MAETAPSRSRRLRQAMPWLAMLLLGAAGAALSLYLSWREVASLMQAAARPARIADEWVQSDWPDVLEATAEHSLRVSPADEGAAYLAARKAVALDPSRAFAWAILAHVETRQAGGVNASALEALERSMTACPLCDQGLVRWRFNFVLAHWSAIPDALRRKAFEQADILRWIGPNAEFLAEMRYKAQLAGIPYDAYRAAVDTPAPSWDIVPAAQLRGAGRPQD